MRSLRAWMLRFGGLFGRRRRERALAEEMESHLQMHIEDNVRAGMSPREARRQALIKLGGMEQAKEKYRQRRGLPFFETLWQDMRYAIRTLGKTPAYTNFVILTLAVGIGVNTAIFSFLYGVILRPVAAKDPKSVVFVYNSEPRQRYGPLSYPEFAYLRDHNTVLSGISVFGGARMTLTSNKDSGGNGAGEVLQANMVSGNYFSLLGQNATVGRTFFPEEDSAPGEHPVVVLSYELWQRRFGGDPGIVGQSITLNLLPYTVVGVAPKSFDGLTPEHLDLWVPIAMQGNAAPGADELSERNSHFLRAVGRLKPGVTREQAQAALTVLERQYSAEDKTDKSQPGKIALTGPTLTDPDTSRQAIPIVGLFLMAVGLILLIVCANVANLVLARGIGRQKEIGIRLSLGAGRFRIVRQLLTENLLLALCGGAGGLLLASWIDDGLLPFIHPPGEQALNINVSPDMTVMFYTAIITLLSGIAFGLLPALRFSKQDLVGIMKEEGISSGRGAKHSRLRNMLVVAQVAMSLFLLTGAGLLVRALWKAQRTDPGFAIHNVLVIKSDMELHKYDAARATSFENQMEQRIEVMPGVLGVSLGNVAPLGNSFWGTYFNPDDYPSSPDDSKYRVSFSGVGPGYFETLGIPIIEGRGFTQSDVAEGRRVAVISQSVAQHFWPGQNAIGKKFNKGDEVIGVAKDVRSVHLYAANDLFLYQLATPKDSTFLKIFMRTRGNPTGIIRSLPSVARSIDPQLNLTISRLEDNLANWIWPAQMGALIAAVLGLLALMLALMGVYGVTSYAVNQRTHEIGVRMALGAQNSDVVRLMIGQGMRLVLIGVTIGILISLAGSRLLAQFLYGLSAVDAGTFAGVALLLAGVAVLACWIPARRAMRVDPMVALRYE
jgi:macrolide transport system ATP-binding/permease protein